MLSCFVTFLKFLIIFEQVALHFYVSPGTWKLCSHSCPSDAGLDEAQAGIKSAVRNNNNLRYADDTTLMAESEEELKSLLMKVKEESEKVG